MSNKQTLQSTNADLAEILSIVQGLPTYVSPEGDYVWKKYDVGDTLTCDVALSSVTITGNTKTNLVFELTGDTSIFTFKSLIGKTIALNYSYATLTITILSETDISYVRSDTGATSTLTNSTWDSDTLTYSFSIGTTSVPTIVSNNLDHTITETVIEDFVDFVVSDDESAYPDGAVHTDGFWYEMVSESAIAFGEVTLTSASETITVEHGLNTIPALCALFTTDIFNVGTGTSAVFEGWYVYNNGVLAGTKIAKTANDITFTSRSSSYKFRANEKYMWIALPQKGESQNEILQNNRKRYYHHDWKWN